MILQFMEAGIYKTNSEKHPFPIVYRVIWKGEIVETCTDEYEALNKLFYKVEDALRSV